MPSNENASLLIRSGSYSPLRYPGGKGKIVKFMRDLVRLNGLSDGMYVEPYAGGAAVAWELLLTGVVRRVAINDINRPVHCFWKNVLDHTEKFCRWIHDVPITLDEWDRQKRVYMEQDNADVFALGCAFFYLNRTNRSGILNGGVIGGRQQMGQWKLDARFNKSGLIERIHRIAAQRSRIELHGMDAQEFLDEKAREWPHNTLIYIDPPYYDKGRYLYYNAYKPEDHAAISRTVRGLPNRYWLVSYDDVPPIHVLYEGESRLRYTLNYSARNIVRGREVMYFSNALRVPVMSAPLVELDRKVA